MTTRVYLMRHGEVQNSGEKRFNGHIDIDITDKGVDQMHRLAELLAKERVSVVYSSDLIRSVRGARIISERIGLEFKAMPELRERSVGAWEGLTAEEIGKRFPEEYAAWRADLLGYRPQGGESVHDVRERVLPVYRGIVAGHQGAEIAMLLHGGVNRIVLADAVGLDLRFLFRMEQSFGAMNIIDYFEDGIAVVNLMNG